MQRCCLLPRTTAKVRLHAAYAQHVLQAPAWWFDAALALSAAVRSNGALSHSILCIACVSLASQRLCSSPDASSAVRCRTARGLCRR